MMPEPELSSIVVEGRRLGFACWGANGMPPLVLLHGLRDNCRSWDVIAARLSAQFRIIAPDLRGHGDSDWAGSEGYALASYVADVSDVVSSLGFERFAVVGHSLGGHIGLRIASVFPERVTALVGIECVELPIVRDEAASPKPFPQRLRHWLEQRSLSQQRTEHHYATFDEARDRLRREQPDLSARTIDHLARHAAVFESGKGWRWKFDRRTTRRAPEDQRGGDLDDVLDAIACPVLLAYGDRSWIPVPPAKRLARLRDHRLVRFADASHWLHHQEPERFGDEVLAHLQTQEIVRHA